MKKKLILFGFGVAAATAAFCVTQFRRWRQVRVSTLRAGGKMAQTARGAVEYDEMGDGPALLLCHGGPGGYDQLYMMADVAAGGFRAICPSRPGYLQTPLSSGSTMAEQADAFVALLDELGIEKTAVIGASAGGPIALEIAMRHPDRVWALVMMAAVAQEYHPNELAAGTPLGRLFLSDAGMTLVDVGMWLLELYTKYAPEESARMMIATESTLSPQQVDTKVAAIMADPSQISWYQQLVTSTTPLSLRRLGLQNDLEQFANLPHYPLESVTAPAFVVHGRCDADVPYSHAEFVAGNILNAQLVTQENSGHLIWLGNEWPETQTKLIQFLREHAPEN